MKRDRDEIVRLDMMTSNLITMIDEIVMFDVIDNEKFLKIFSDGRKACVELRLVLQQALRRDDKP